MPDSKNRVAAVHPDQIKLTPMQVERLSAVSGISVKEMDGLTVREISERHKFQIDHSFLRFRRVCGQVVKKDPVSGIEYPVPYATVHVEDTDCSFLRFFPLKGKWGWYFPFKCHREEIATARTDECGKFCVWIPRWDIDWVVRFRRERICFPIIFYPLNIHDLLVDHIDQPIPPRFPPPPEPGPISTIDLGRLRQLMEYHLGADAAAALDQVATQEIFATNNPEIPSLLDAPVFERLAPPLPQELRVGGGIGAKAKDVAAEPTMDTARNSLAARLKADPDTLKHLDFRKSIGPFMRCFDVVIPEWTWLWDVPDITFRVTQDINGDGTEETVYSEGYFQVRWDAVFLGPVKLSANQTARAGLRCGGDVVPCGNVPAIVLAGRMPVVNAPTVYDPVNGYALRPNRPHPSGLFADPLPNPNAATPFYGTLSLFGCNKTHPNATQYRLLYKYSADGGATFTGYTPFAGLTWPLFRLDAGGHLQWHYPVANAQGWYPIGLPAGPNPWLPSDLLLDWPTTAFHNGRYVLKVELGAGGAPVATSAEVAFTVDNSGPRGPITVEWRKFGVGAFQQLPFMCPNVRRGAVPVDTEFRVTLAASATHLRSARLYAYGCGGGGFVYVSGTTEHWHTSTADNSETMQAIFRLPAAALAGTYSFWAHVASRAMNPNGGDGGHLVLPNAWEYNPDDIHIDPSFSFSVVDAN